MVNILLGSIGKEITATDSSGATITNLSDDIEIKLVYYKDDISSSLTDYSKLRALTNSYWDTSLSNWVTLSTTKTAYIKASSSDTDWTIITDYNAFVSTLINNSEAYADYKIELNSNTDHLTIFGATIPTDSTAPNAPTELTQTSGTGTSVLINWLDNTETDLLEYEIYRATSTGVNISQANQINTTSITSSSYTDTTTEEFNVYYYIVSAVDDSGNESSASSEIQICSTTNVLNGNIDNNCVITCNNDYELSGTNCVATTNNAGNNGGHLTSTPQSHQVHFTDNNVNSTKKTTITPEWQVIVDMANKLAGLKAEKADANLSKTKYNNKQYKAESLINSIISEAEMVNAADADTFVVKFNTKRNKSSEDATFKKYIKKIDIKNELSSKNRKSINNFITYGTFTTIKLGAGERAGSINSFKSAFQKLPDSKEDWEDVIKIANGRWPTQKNTASEKRATEEFKNIYKREPSRNNPNDDAVITVIAYGLRPRDRNLDSEKAAIKSFKHIYKDSPTTTIAWDIVRAIAYSGASR